MGEVSAEKERFVKHQHGAKELKARDPQKGYVCR